MKRPYGNFIIKRKLKFENYKSSSEATQLENEINHLQKNQIDLDILKKDYKEFIKSNKLILKTQQRFKSESHNVFTKEINKIALSSNAITWFDRNTYEIWNEQRSNKWQKRLIVTV